MKISKVEVIKLFGFYNYSIEFFDTITIIHGPNGCGKTTMLKIIDAVFNKNIQNIITTDFESVKFFFSNDSILSVDRKKRYLYEEKKDTPIIYFVYTIDDGENKTIFDAFENSEDIMTSIKSVLRTYRPLPYLQRINAERWFDRKHQVNLSTDDVIQQYGYALYQRYGQEIIGEDFPKEVQSIIDSVNVRLISADRLTVRTENENNYGEPDIKIEQRVSIIANDVSKKIKDAIQKYAQLSQAKDRTFPLRAIRQTSSMTVEEIKEKMLDLETKRKEFIETGILEEEKDSINIHDLLEAITEENRQYLSLYAIDTEEKLNALSGLSSSINLFRKLIEKKFKMKEIVFNKDTGFNFKTKYSDAIIKPQFLSSGEQHEIVMLYDLIFNTSNDTLILIDEPELSLHIEWQINYVDELLDIIKNAGFYSVLATHSPQIINDNWDLTIALENITE